MAEKRIGSLASLLPHPGETLLELLDSYGMSQVELAQRIGYTPKHINEVCKGIKGITPDMAMRLSSVFALSAAFWNSLQANYDSEYLELIAEETVTEEELTILKEVPLAELVRYHYVSEDITRSKRRAVLGLRNFFRVSSLSFIPSVLDSSGSAYRKGDGEISKIKLATWVAMCLHEYKPSPGKLDVGRLQSSMAELKAQILRYDVNEAIENFGRILAPCGIDFHVVHHLKGVPVQGYIRNMNGRFLLSLTIRNKFADNFYFTFFHELGHVLANRNKKTFNFLDFEGQSDFASEKSADAFASSVLIGKSAFESFLAGEISEESIRAFAKQQGVTASIVVGRLGHLDPSYYARFAFLRERYEWAE